MLPVLLEGEVGDSGSRRIEEEGGRGMLAGGLELFREERQEVDFKGGARF